MYLYGRGYISGADEASKPDNDFSTFEVFYVVSSFF